MTDNRDIFTLDRILGYDTFLVYVEEKKAEVAPSILLDFHSVNPESASQSAQFEIWGLIAAGITHLKSGGPQGTFGMMSSALSKASLRSSTLASSLGVSAPVFEPILLPADYKNGFGAARQHVMDMMSMALHDFKKSREIMSEKIAKADPAKALGIGGDPSLGQAFSAAQPALPAGLEDIKRQLLLTFNALVEYYPKICSGLAHDAMDMNRPPRKPPANGLNI